VARNRQLTICLLAGCLSIAAGVEPAAPADLIPAVEVGYDRFAQVFRLTDASLGEDATGGLELGSSLRDTTDVFTERRAQGELRYLDSDGAHRYDILALGSVGTSLNRALFNGWYRYRPPSGVTFWDAEFFLEGRHFKSDSEFNLSHDNLRAEGRVHWRRRVSRPLELGVKLREQMVLYQGRSEFEMDQHRWTLSGTAAIIHGFTMRANLEAGGGTQSIPDSSQISYDRVFARGDLYWGFGIGHHLSLYLASEHRVFRDEGVRSPYWDFVLEPDLLFEIGPRWGVRIRSPQEILRYDRDGTVYQDTWLGRVGVEGFRRFGLWEVGLEPRFSWQISPYEVDDEFSQPSLVFRLEVYGTGRFWISFSEEFGRRHYEVSLDEELAFYSDFTFFRTTLLATYRFLDNLSFDAFISDEPEIHQRDEDDSRLGLYSFALRATF
jgi:hypothetical protein